MNIVQRPIVLLSLTVLFTLSIILIPGDQAFSVEYTNYTNEEHGIQFQYPTDWKINEKNSDLDSVPDIEISSDSTSQEKNLSFPQRLDFRLF